MDIPACWLWTLPPQRPSARERFIEFHIGPDGGDLLPRCAICGAHDPNPIDDHDHLTGPRRGLLCRPCNVAEGRSAQVLFARYRRRSPALILGFREYYVGRGWPHGWWEDPTHAARLTGDPGWSRVDAGGEADRRQPSTPRVYRHAWQRFAEWCARNGADSLPACEATLLSYVAHLAATGVAPSTANVTFAALKSVHRQAHPPVAWAGGPRLAGALRELQDGRRAAGWRPKATRALLPEQAERLLAAADADGHRASALVALMLYTGARVSELLAADVSDIVEEAGVPVLRIVGKGRKLRNVPVIPAAYLRLERYLACRPRTQPLFATATGKRLSATEVRRILLRAAKQAGLEPEVVAELTPHSTRATYATSNLAAGTPLRDVQYALGHEDPRTTEGYDRSSLQLDRHPSSRLAAVIRPPDFE